MDLDLVVDVVVDVDVDVDVDLDLVLDLDLNLDLDPPRPDAVLAAPPLLPPCTGERRTRRRSSKGAA